MSITAETTEQSTVAWFDEQIRNATSEEERLAWQPHRDMLLFDVSLNSICCWLGYNLKEIFSLEKKEEEENIDCSKELAKLEEKRNFLLDLKQQIYSGNEEVMYKVYNNTKETIYNK